jgi:hypothetical protein
MKDLVLKVDPKELQSRIEKLEPNVAMPYVEKELP